MGIKIDLLDNACSQLGDAVVDPSNWPDIMELMCAAVGASGAMLLQTDVRTPDVPRTASIAEGVDYYFKHEWHVRDARGRFGAPLLARGQPVIIDQDFMTPDRIARDEFYNECLAIIDMPWFAAVGFHAGTALWALCLQRGKRLGPFPPSDRRALAGLSRRLTETATLSTTVGRAALHGVTNTLDLLSQAALAIDRAGLVVDINAAADRLLDDELYVSNRTLVVRDATTRGRYEQFVARMRTTPETQTLPADPFVVRRRSGPVLIRVLPVPAAARSPFLGARAILTLTSLENRRRADVDMLRDLFRLTPAETKLVALLADGLTLWEAASELGIAKETARTHLKSVFSKTDVHRQSELTALLSRIERL